MKELAAAERYASALFEVAREVRKDAEIEAELVSFSAVLKKTPQAEKFLQNPYFEAEKKIAFLGKLYQAADADVRRILLSFFEVLFRKNRFACIHEIAAGFKKIADEAQGEATAVIKTAVPISSHAEEAIVSRLEKLSGVKVTVKKEVDPLLLGGVFVKIRNRVLDGTVRHRLNLLKKNLLEIKTV